MVHSVRRLLIGLIISLGLGSVVYSQTFNFVPTAPANTNNNTAASTAYADRAANSKLFFSGTVVNGHCLEAGAAANSVIDAGVAGCGSGGTAGTNLGWINIATNGSTGNGNCVLLSSIYANLAAAQAVYPFVSDLAQCADWAAIQQSINQSYNTAPLANGSFTTYCPTATYITSNPLILDIPNNTAGTSAAWAAGTTYPNAATVKYNGLPWLSMGSGNIGNPPTAYQNHPANMVITQGGDNPNSAMPWATVSITNANPAVITPLLGGGSSIAVTANQPIVFFTQQFANPATGATPALPTGINANQVYYVVGSSITSTTFTVSATPGGAAVATSSTGTGHFFASGQVWQINPIQVAGDFSQRISFVGDEGLPGNSGCTIKTDGNYTSPALIVGPANGLLVKNIYVQGNVSASVGSPGANGYRCSVPASLGGPAGPQVAAVGIATMSNGGGSSRALFENVGIADFYINDERSFGTAGSLVDQNTWIKPLYNGACIGLLFNSTQSFINTMYDGTIFENTTGIVASTQEGIKVIGGNHSTADGLANTFTISSVSSAAGCGFLCVTATLSSDDNNLRSPMCGYSAAQAFHSGATYLNAWPYASGCGYNTFTIKTTQWGNIGMYVMDYNPFTKVIVLGIPSAYTAIYQGACCGSNLTTQIAAATTLLAVEAANPFFGQIQVEDIHTENDGVPYTLLNNATSFFGGAKVASLRNIFLNTEGSLGNTSCCNQSQNNNFVYQFNTQQVIPFINCTVGDCIVEAITGGSNFANQATAFDMDRLSIAGSTGTNIEFNHTPGGNNQSVASGSANNVSGPIYDFMPGGVGGGFTTTPPLVNSGTNGQLSGGYYAFGCSAYGCGHWDNGSSLGPFSQYSIASGALTDMFDQWPMRGWGQSPQWGARPAPYASPCILPSQATSLGALPTITYVANLHDFLVVTAGGTGYTVGNILTLVGGTGTAATVQVTAVSSGAVTAVQIQTAGAYTTIAPGLTTFTSTGAGTGATFAATGPIWYVNYNIGYPRIWGGHVYKACNFNNATFGGKYGLVSSHTAYSYGQALTTTNVPHLKWTMDGASPFIYMNYEALELMFPGLKLSLVSDGTGGCTTIAAQTFVVLEVHPTLGYVKVVRSDNDGSNYVPALAASGTTCTNNTIGQEAYAITNPF